MPFVLQLAPTVVLIVWVLGQVRKPSGPLGRRAVRAMNLTHSGLTDWRRWPRSGRSFDVVTAVETHYHWPDLLANTREVLRVLEPGGMFALIAEIHRDGWFGALYAVPMLLIRAAHLSDAEHRELLIRAGFTEVATRLAPGKNWICATGRRPRAV